MNSNNVTPSSEFVHHVSTGQFEGGGEEVASFMTVILN
jgi:hypothetical protein